MTYEHLETLSRIYNTLLLVNTKGEDTMVMAECLNALKTFVLTEKRILETKNTETKEEA